MPDKKQPKLYFNGWEFIPLVLFATSVFFSRALLSLSVGLMLIWIVLMIIRDPEVACTRFKSTTKTLLILLLAWVVLVMLDIFRASDFNDWFKEVMIKIPLLVAAVYATLLPRGDCKLENSWLIMVILTGAVAIASSINYFMHFAEINQLLLQSKHVPIFSNMHHIYFGVYCTISIWLSLYFYKNGSKPKLWAVLGILLFVLMHILVSRTGLVALYASIFVFLIVNEFREKRYKRLIFGLLMLTFAPLIVYNVSSSFRNKVENSIQDFNALRTQKEINYKSFAMRYEAWKTSFHVIRDHSWIGVGSINTEEKLQAQYVEDQTVLYKENRVGPHNQFIEIMMAHGWLGLTILVLFLSLWLNVIRTKPILLAAFVVFGFSFLLESFLERQQGILLFCLFVFAFIPVPSDIKNETET